MTVAGLHTGGETFLQRHVRTRTKPLPNGHIVYVGRPTKWGNPWVLPKPPTFPDRVRVVRAHEIDLLWSWLNPDQATGAGHYCGFTLAELQRSLRGRELACWCPAEMPCHADTLMRYANLNVILTIDSARDYFERQLLALQEAARAARIDPRTLDHQGRLL